jgi:hypothetical protein
MMMQSIRLQRLPYPRAHSGMSYYRWSRARRANLKPQQS